MIRVRLIVIIFLSVMAVNACGRDPGGAGDTDAGGDTDTGRCDVFDEGKVLQVGLTLPAEDWAYLKANAALEVYTPAQATIDGEDIGEVGLRFKGS